MNEGRQYVCIAGAKKKSDRNTPTIPSSSSLTLILASTFLIPLLRSINTNCGTCKIVSMTEEDQWHHHIDFGDAENTLGNVHEFRFGGKKSGDPKSLHQVNSKTIGL